MELVGFLHVLGRRSVLVLVLVDGFFQDLVSVTRGSRDGRGDGRRGGLFLRLVVAARLLDVRVVFVLLVIVALVLLLALLGLLGCALILLQLEA